MNAELIAVGSELLRFGKRDTNSDWLVGQLQRVGYEVTVRSAVDDDVERIAALVRAAMERVDLVLLCGGLGPTEDDRTREALARGLGVPLELDEQRVVQLRELYARYGRKLDPAQSNQAKRPRGASWIENPLGSAPGVLVDRGEVRLAALPGVPAEMRAMFEETLLPMLIRERRSPLRGLTLKIVRHSESSLDERLRDLYGLAGLDVTVLGTMEGLELHVRARSEGLREFEAQVRRRLGHDVFGVNDDRLAGVVGRLLVAQRRTVATAESCTAGLLGAALTGVPGSSAWFRGGLIVYSDDLKQTLAGVRRGTLEAHGAVSEPVVRELAAGARSRCGADLALALTGVAGPGGGTADKPVGLVHLGLADDRGGLHRRVRFVGDRDTVRHRAVTAALDMLRRRLLESP